MKGIKGTKRFYRGLLLVTFIFVLLFILVRLFVPTYLDKSMNRISLKPPYIVSEQTERLYQSLTFIADLHSDVLLWDRDINHRHDYGHQDLPRMIEANLALQGMTIVNKVPKDLNFQANSADSDQLTLPMILQGRPIKAWFDLTQRVVAQSEALHQYAAESNGQLLVIKSQEELKKYIQQRQSQPKISAAFLGIEGGQALQGDLKNLQIVFDAGVRMLGLTHFFDNEIGGSAHGISQYGLTPFGRQLIPVLESKGILIDLSHASPRLFEEVLMIAKKPVVVSHTGVKATCNNVRNLSDLQIKKIAQNGGLIGIAMFPKAICDNTPLAIAKAINHVIQLVGAKHVALGSDFDGAVTATFEVGGLKLIVDALLRENVSEQDIRLVMGENVKRLLLNSLPE